VCVCRGEYAGLFVCHVCLHMSVRLHNSKTTRPNFKMLPVAVARSFSDGVAIR